MHAMHLKSVSAVAEHIENCVSAGFLEKIPKSPRSLVVVEAKTYDESIQLFKEKITELSADNKNQEKIDTLKSAAQILELKID